MSFMRYIAQHGAAWNQGHQCGENISVIVYRSRIVNPFSKTFQTKFLSRIIPVIEEDKKNWINSQTISPFPRKTTTRESESYPQGTPRFRKAGSQPKQMHTLFNHCSKRHINQHLKTKNLVKNVFLPHKFSTLGYIIPNQKREVLYFYSKKTITAKPIDMLDVRNSTRDNSEGKLLRYVQAEDYQGKGYNLLQSKMNRGMVLLLRPPKLCDEKERTYAPGLLLLIKI